MLFEYSDSSQDYQELVETCVHIWDDHFSSCLLDLVFLVNLLIKVILSKLINMYIVFQLSVDGYGL